MTALDRQSTDHPPTDRPRVVWVGEREYLLESADGTRLQRSLAVQQAFVRLFHRRPSWVTDVVPGLDTLLLRLSRFADPDDPVQAALLNTALEALNSPAESVMAEPTRMVEIPVRYGGDAGPDLPALASRCGLTPGQVIALHSEMEFRAAFLGFSPGFAYLLGLAEQLHVPRLATPRPRVPAGSVAVAGPFSAVYPQASAGGWHLIGRTDAVLFDPHRSPPTLIQPGDTVRFVAV